MDDDDSAPTSNATELRSSLLARIEQARGSAGQLKAVFEHLDQRLGRSAASALWWAAFGAQDAAET